MSAGHTASDHRGAHAHPLPSRRFLSLLNKERSEVWSMVLFSLISGALYLATPLAVDAVVNNIAFGGEQQVYVQALVILSVALLFLLGLLALIRTAQAVVMEQIQRRIFVRVAADLSYRLPRVCMEELDSRQGPELINRFFDVVVLQKSTTTLLLDGLNTLFSTLMGLLVLGIYHPMLLTFALVLLLLLVVVVFVPAHRGVRTSIQESYAKHALVGWLEQMVMFPLVFRSRGGAELACRRTDQLAQNYLATRRSHFRVLMGQIVSLLAIQAIASAALLTLGGWLVMRGELTLGQLVASELILAAIVSAINKLGKHLEVWYDALAAVDKLGYLIDLPIERETGETPAPGASAGMDVEMRNLTFAYGPAHPILDNFSWHIRPGEHVGLVGAAGHGASTLLDILAGLRHSHAGATLLDGLDLRQWRLEAVRRDVALVRGHDLIAGSITENICLGRPDVTQQEVQSALRKLGVLDAFLRFPDGLDTRLSPGGAPLSSSQRTLLLIARAIVGRPRLLLVDETLEGLDTEFVPALQSLLLDPKSGWTLILVTRDPGWLARCKTQIPLDASHLRQSRQPATKPPVR